MKGIFIAYDQAYNMEIADVLEQLGCRGFTMWQDIAGRGGIDGEPPGTLKNHTKPLRYHYCKSSRNSLYLRLD